MKKIRAYAELTSPSDSFPEHTRDRHAKSEEADATLQQCQRGRNDGVLRTGKRRGRTEQTLHETQEAPGQSPGLPQI